MARCSVWSDFLVYDGKGGLLAEGLDDLMQSDHVNGILG
jgi:hypothetical protein